MDYWQIEFQLTNSLHPTGPWIWIKKCLFPNLFSGAFAPILNERVARTWVGAFVCMKFMVKWASNKEILERWRLFDDHFWIFTLICFFIFNLSLETQALDFLEIQLHETNRLTWPIKERAQILGNSGLSWAYANDHLSSFLYIQGNYRNLALQVISTIYFWLVTYRWTQERK